MGGCTILEIESACFSMESEAEAFTASLNGLAGLLVVPGSPAACLIQASETDGRTS